MSGNSGRDSIRIRSGKIALQFRIRNGILYAAVRGAAEFTGIGKISARPVSMKKQISKENDNEQETNSFNDS